MQSLSSEAIILDAMDLHDRDRIVTFLARTVGKRKGVARGARRKFSRFAGQLQPLAKVQVKWFEKEGRELARIDSIELLRPAQRLYADLEGILLGSYLADHIVQFAQESETTDHLYRLLDSTIEALLGGAQRDLVTRYFEVWVLRLAGIFPDSRECPVCGGAFGERGASLPGGGDALLCRDCSGGAPALRADREVLDTLDAMSRQRVSSMSERPPAARVLRTLEVLSARLRRQFLQQELRSYEVMERTLQSCADASTAAGRPLVP